MARPDLGTKRIDPETGGKFYDLGKRPIVSPYTGTSYPLSFFEAPPSAPSRYAAAAARVMRRAEPQEETVEVQDEEAETVSLSDVEKDENADAKSDIDVDDDEVEKDDDAVLALDEDGDEDVDDIVGERDDEEG